MFRINKERLKAYILLVLIMTSFLQVGILWEYQNHGFPISFLAAFLGNTSTSAADSREKAIEEYFVPYRMIISDGNEIHWLIGKQDQNHTILWKEAKYYLLASLNSKPIQTMPAASWGDLVTKKTIIFEFKNSIDIDLIGCFLSAHEIEASSPSGLYKMMIVPWDNVNGNRNTLYIMDKSKIYKYETAFDKDGLNLESYEDIISKLRLDKEHKFRGYSIIKELDPNRKSLSSVNPDILCVIKEPRYRPFRNISYTIPDRISELKEMASIFLGDDKSGYDRSLDIHNTVVFNNMESIYRIFNDGLLEYKYIPGPKELDNKDIGESFLNAYTFISTIQNNLISGTDLFLTGIEKKDGNYYEITFEYILGDIPVIMDYQERGKDSQPVKNAVVIKANGRRILECRWMMKKLEYGREENAYDLNVVNLLDSSKLSYTEVSIHDMFAAYIVKEDIQKEVIPVWVIEKTGGGLHIVSMQKQKGD